MYTENTKVEEGNHAVEYNLSKRVIGIAIDLHQQLGLGLLESAYKECLYYKLVQEGVRVEKEKAIPLVFEGVKLECGYRADLLIENKLIVEIKSVDALNEIHLAQVLTYLKVGKFNLGLLINFNVALLKNGIKRVING